LVKKSKRCEKDFEVICW